MDTYEIVELNPDGSGYVVFHWEDGSSTGQQLSQMPVHDKAAFNAALLNLMPEVKARAVVRDEPVIAGDVSEMIGAPRSVDILKADVEAAAEIAEATKR